MHFFTRITKYILILLCFACSQAKAQPVANFTANITSGCAPLVVQFTSTSTGNPTSYSWTLGNSVNSVLPNPSTTYSVPGTYTVTLTVTNASGSNTKTVTGYITVNPSPIVDFTGTPLAGCPGTQVNFTNTSSPNTPGAATYLWGFGDGNSATTQNASNIYYNSGLFNVSLQVTNSAGCSKSVVKTNYVEIYPKPVANFTATPLSPCFPPATVNFTSTVLSGTSPFSYAWNFGDLGTSPLQNPPHTYLTSNSFNVRLIVTDSRGCKDTANKPGYINVGQLQPQFTYPTAGACPKDSVNFINTTNPAPQNVFWDFGDGFQANSINAKHAFANPGTYPVKMIAYNNGCYDSVIHNITIHPNPHAAQTHSPNPPCPAPVTLQFNNTSTGATSYVWKFGDGSPTTTTTNPSHTYLGDSAYISTLVAISSFGCRDTTRDTIYIYDIHVLPTSVPGHGCAPVTTTFGSYSSAQTYPTWYIPFPFPYSAIIGAAPFHYNPQPFGITSYDWDFGDNTPHSNLPTPTHTYPNPGTYPAVLTVVTGNGCTLRDTVRINVGTLPTPSFYATPLTNCLRDSIHFYNTSTNVNSNTTYLWSFGGGAPSTGEVNPVVHFIQPGVFTVTLHAYNNGCEDSFKIVNYIHALAPKAVPDFTFSCDTPTMVHFYNNSIGDSSRIWLFGDGGTSTQGNVNHNYPALGTYTVKLCTYNSTTGCRDTATDQVVLFDPHPTFQSNDTAICKDDSINLSISNYANVVTLHSWKIEPPLFQDTSTSFTTFHHTFNQVGYHTITLYYMDFHGCQDSVKKVNYQLVSKPTVNFGGTPLLGCTPMPVQFQDSSWYLTGTYASTRLWSFGDGGNLTGNNASPNHTYTTAGVYDVKLTVTDNVGCTDSFTRSAYVEARHPIANFAADDTAACIGQVITFYNNSVSPVNLTYNWDFGDNTATSAAQQPTHSYAATGVYNVRLIVTDATGCKDTLKKLNYIHIGKPHAGFTMSDTFAICPPLAVQFTNTSTGAQSYSWTFGPSTTPSTVPNPSYFYNAAGIYNIMLVAQDAEGCTDTAYGRAKVLGYAGALTYTPLTGCVPLTVNFTANINNVPSLIWDFSDGVTQNATGPTISHTYNTIGAYLPKLIISDGNGCLTNSNGLDTIKVDGVDAGFIYGPACEKEPTQFTDTSHSAFTPLTGWVWNFGGLGYASAQHPTFTFPGPGTYSVTQIVLNGRGCRDTAVGTVVVNAQPVIDAGRDTVICKGDAATLYPSGGVSYSWTPVTTLSCSNCTNPQASPVNPTTYTVTGTDANGCSNKDTVKVFIQIKTTAATTTEAEVCLGSGVQLTASGAQVYQWSPAGTLTNANTATPIAFPSQTMTYMVISWEGSCIPDTDYVHVTVHPKPKVNAGADVTILSGGSTTLQGTGSGIFKYFWANDGTLSCDSCSNPIAKPNATTTYTLTGYTEYGCADSDRVTVHVLCDKSLVFIPNTFTPNGDGHNDYFYPRGTGIDQIKMMRVYNRWGQVVYERSSFGINDKTSGWDGTYKGSPLPPDVFVYLIEATCQNGEPITFKGDIAIIR